MEPHSRPAAAPRELVADAAPAEAVCEVAQNLDRAAEVQLADVFERESVEGRLGAYWPTFSDGMAGKAGSEGAQDR
jgi:hypothetical protein